MSRLALIAVSVLAVAAPVLAGDEPPSTVAQGVSESIDNQEMEALVRGMGFDCERLDEKTLKFELDGYKVVLFNYEKNCQLYAGFRSDCSLRKINEWNRTKRFSRAYIDDEGDPCVEADLDFDGGVSRDAVKEFIRTFRLSVTQFAKFVEEK